MLNPISNLAAKVKHVVGELVGHFMFARYTTGSWTSAYSLSSKKVDYQLARELYYNDASSYKLGAGFAKPIINAAVGFIGVPTFQVEDEKAEEVLETFISEHKSKMQQTHRDALRDGRTYVRLVREELTDSKLYPERDSIIHYQIVPVECMKKFVKHPVTNTVTEATIETVHALGDGETATVTQQITPDTLTINVQGTAPEGLKEGTTSNPWGFVPVVEFANEKEAYSSDPRSDLEGVEPYIKAYHDVFKHAIQGSKLHSTPRLKMKLSDIAGFLQNNFGITDPAEFVKSGGQISLENKDLLIFTEEEEDAEFIEVESAIGSAEPLLQLLFYNIVENSETPEFCFGAHLPANYASVKEQMPIVIRRVHRKREFFDEPWRRLGRFVLTMTSLAENITFSTHDSKLGWDEIDPRDASDVAKALRDTTEGLTQAQEQGLISKESASNYLAKHVSTMQSYKEEQARVDQSSESENVDGT